MRFIGTSTLDQIWAFLRRNWRNKGVKCPACGQHVQRRKRNLRDVWAGLLVWMDSISKPGEYVHVQRIGPRNVIRSKDYSMLVHFGAIEPRVSEGPRKKRGTGEYRLTDAGRAFARGEGRLPAHIFTYNAACDEVSEETVALNDVRGKGFGFDELFEEAG